MKRLNISLAIGFVALMSNALAQDAVAGFSSAELTKRTLERRAVDAAIWGMPIVSFDVMRQGFFRDAKAHYGDIMYWSKFSTLEEPDDHARHLYPICHFLYEHQGWAGRGRGASGGRRRALRDVVGCVASTVG